MIYSQRDEEPVILANTPQNGRFLDCGAYDLIIFSNTRALIERGWSGVFVEPSSGPFTGMVQNAKGCERITLVNAAVTPHYDGLMKFYHSHDAIATSDEKHAEKWKAANYTPIWVAGVSVMKLIEKFGPFDFINVDTEGTSYEILKAIYLDAAGCNLVCVEKDESKAVMEEYLNSVGFKVIHETAENLIAKRIA